MTDTSTGTSKNPGLAAVLSAAVPGAGQWYGGRVRRAVLVFLPTVALVALASALWSRGAIRIVELLVQPAVLWALLVVNLAILAWRGFVVVDAFQVTRNGTRPGWFAVTVLSVTLVAVAAPHVVFVAYDLEAIDLLESVFVDGDVAAPVFDEDPPPSIVRSIPGDTVPIEVPDPALVATPIIVTPRSTRNLIFRPGVGDPAAIASWPDIISKPVPAIDLVPKVDTEGVDRITILLAGGDAGPGRGGLRTDTIIVATVDTTTGNAALMSIPRNMVQVPLKP